MKILVINGPNINMLGIREPAIYGDRNYEALINQINVWGAELHAEVECYQSNHEGDIVDKIQDALGKFDGIVINPAAYTHTRCNTRRAESRFHTGLRGTHFGR